MFFFFFFFKQKTAYEIYQCDWSSDVCSSDLMWANLAASRGGEDTVRKRDAIAIIMTPHQIAEAQKLAREWKPAREEEEEVP